MCIRPFCFSTKCVAFAIWYAKQISDKILYLSDRVFFRPVIYGILNFSPQAHVILFSQLSIALSLWAWVSLPLISADYIHDMLNFNSCYVSYNVTSPLFNLGLSQPVGTWAGQILLQSRIIKNQLFICWLLYSRTPMKHASIVCYPPGSFLKSAQYHPPYPSHTPVMCRLTSGQWVGLTYQRSAVYRMLQHH